MPCKRSSYVCLGLFAFVFLKAQVNPKSLINDSSIARYRYEERIIERAEIPSGTDIEQIDLRERDLLQSRKTRRNISIGINSAHQIFQLNENIFSTPLESWIPRPDYQFISPHASYGYDSLGDEVYKFPHNPEELLIHQQTAQAISQRGFQPIMLFFPNRRDSLIQEIVNQGALLLELPHEAFKIIQNGQEVLFKPDEKTIAYQFQWDSLEFEIKREYRLFSPYGYVPVYEEERQHRRDHDHPVTFVRTSTFHNHVIEDLAHQIPKYTELAHIEVYPNPVEDQFEILLRGIPEAQVSQIQVRDHLGNVIQTYLNPAVNQDIIALNGASYPSGVLIIIIQTQHGLYSETFSKI